jgi:hypothetical protein
MATANSFIAIHFQLGKPEMKQLLTAAAAMLMAGTAIFGSAEAATFKPIAKGKSLVMRPSTAPTSAFDQVEIGVIGSGPRVRPALMRSRPTATDQPLTPKGHSKS